ncbi:dihydroorotase [Stenomitos frigidus]|uniref:Dihydroorotase n=1 Tax=Stenomitos frigidus ULC18 TaxID=2107698 RepID=A0A2T1E9G9_9CYAN|nr:dihydroorotase [Stenomitos frigidus]PSB29335.1 dihydroorotase [Stenomitos frigidus ULC18]
MPSELLQQVRVIDPVSDTDRIADVLITDGVVTAIEGAISDYPSETNVLDGRGLILGTGLVDLYSHSGEPGFEERETLQSLLQAASAGGFTRIAILPDTNPATDNPGSVSWLQTRWREERGAGSRRSAGEAEGAGSRSQASHLTPYTPHPIPYLYCWGALTLGVQGQQMTELGELSATDIVGFADGRSLTSLLLVRRLLEYLKPIAKPIALWAADPTLSGNGVMREGQESLLFGLPGIPAIAETAALSALLECVEAIGTPVHLMRLSTARGVMLIQAAKARGLPITASTTWMHLLLNSEAIGSYDPNLRIAPPLGNPADQEALVQAVKEGIIDAIAIDHTPYTYEEKTVAFAEAPSGAIGLELALPSLWQALVETGRWTALDLWRSLSSRPALCLHQKVAAIAPGQPAELTLFDPQQTWTVEARSLKSLSANTPWLHKEVTGRVVRTWVGEKG